MPRVERVRSEDVTVDEDLTFRDLQLPESLVNGLRNCGLHTPSPVQRAAIPLGRLGADLMVQAKSGTGKTMTFGSILLERVVRTTQTTQALVVAPTREVAQQTHDALKQLSAACDLGKDQLTLHVCLGGLPVALDRSALSNNPHVAVGTPGRLRQLFEEGSLVSTYIQQFVIDEADLLMTGSFERDVLFLYSMLPEKKQVMAFSATFPEHIVERVNGFLKNPHKVELCTQNTNALFAVRQFYLQVDGADEGGMFQTGGHTSNDMQHVSNHPHNSNDPSVINSLKDSALLNLFKKITFHQCVVFVKRPGRGEALCRLLKTNATPAVFISGTLQQKERQKVMKAMRGFEARVLVSTDLTARGIDLTRVNLVVHLDVPSDKETYSHRVGRAGRFGTNGISVTVVTGDELRNLRSLLTCAVSTGVDVDVVETVDNVDNVDSVATLTPAVRLEPLPSVVPDDWYAYELDPEDAEKAEALRLEGEALVAAKEEEDVEDDIVYEEDGWSEQEEGFFEDETYEEEFYVDEHDSSWRSRREWASWWWWFWKDREEARGGNGKEPWAVPPLHQTFGRAQPKGGYRQ